MKPSPSFSEWRHHAYILTFQITKATDIFPLSLGRRYLLMNNLFLSSFLPLLPSLPFLFHRKGNILAIYLKTEFLIFCSSSLWCNFTVYTGNISVYICVILWEMGAKMLFWNNFFPLWEISCLCSVGIYVRKMLFSH